MTSPAVRILGIDPGLNITGYGVLEVVPRTVAAVRGRGRARQDERSMAARLVEIHAGVVDVIASLAPSTVAIEQLYSHYKHPRTAILMGHARGVICLAAAQAGVEVVNYSATQIKRILTGDGHAPKVQMQQAVQRELSLATAPDPPDVADALAAALCHYYLGVRPNQLKQKRA